MTSCNVDQRGPRVWLEGWRIPLDQNMDAVITGISGPRDKHKINPEFLCLLCSRGGGDTTVQVVSRGGVQESRRESAEKHR
jgi:hypothetical protein